MAQLGFLSLSDAETCFRFFGYLNKENPTLGAVTLAGFVRFWGYVMLAMTVIVAVFKKEVTDYGDEKRDSLAVSPHQGVGEVMLLQLTRATVGSENTLQLCVLVSPPTSPRYRCTNNPKRQLALNHLHVSSQSRPQHHPQHCSHLSERQTHQLTSSSLLHLHEQQDQILYHPAPATSHQPHSTRSLNTLPTATSSPVSTTDSRSSLFECVVTDLSADDEDENDINENSRSNKCFDGPRQRDSPPSAHLHPLPLHQSLFPQTCTISNSREGAGNTPPHPPPSSDFSQLNEPDWHSPSQPPTSTLSSATALYELSKGKVSINGEPSLHPQCDSLHQAPRKAFAITITPVSAPPNNVEESSHHLIRPHSSESLAAQQSQLPSPQLTSIKQPDFPRNSRSVSPNLKDPHLNSICVSQTVNTPPRQTGPFNRTYLSTSLEFTRAPSISEPTSRSTNFICHLLHATHHPSHSAEYSEYTSHFTHLTFHSPHISKPDSCNVTHSLRMPAVPPHLP
eukprot:GHVN01056827.1.p1 GENE.GHVN01056827.1~~GHVN01056827.1.p1  ORF type:complete len:508 (+),score=117.15 GHVN01056827.1:2545-4068(+)